MKQLDEMEGMAREWTEEYQSSLSVEELSNELARALLTVMPTIRAALDWRDDRHRDPVAVCSEVDLLRAIDDLRRRLGGE